MKMPDVNVLVYAHRTEVPGHGGYRRWLTSLAEGRQPFALSSLVAAGFVRIVTNRRIFPEPTPLATAVHDVQALAGRPGCRVVGPGPGHLELLDAVCRAGDVAGAGVADAQHAAVAIEHGCTLVTRDGGFARFEAADLRWEHLDL